MNRHTNKSFNTKNVDVNENKQDSPNNKTIDDENIKITRRSMDISEVSEQRICNCHTSESDKDNVNQDKFVNKDKDKNKENR